MALGLAVGVVRDFFLQLHLSSLVVLLCPPRGEERLLLKELGGFSLAFSPAAVQDMPDFRGGVLMDLDCPSAGALLQRFSRDKSFGIHTEWLFIERVVSTQQFQAEGGAQKLRDAYLLPSSAATLAQTDGREVAYYELFRPSMTRPLQAVLRSRQSAAAFVPFQLRTAQRRDLQGVTLTSAAAMYHPELFLGFNSYERPEVDTIPKVNYPIVETLTEQLNFSNTLLIIGDYGWQTNMTFSGLVGLLQREEIDFGATGIFMRPDRIVTIDFTGDTFEIKSKLIFKQPALSSVSNIFVLPFTVMVWVCCLALSGLTACLLILDGLVTIGKREPFEGPATPADILTTIIGCICQQGASVIPKSGSAKLTLFLFSLCTLFFYTSYSANIVALLQSTAPTIRTLSDLTASPLEVVVQDVIYNHIYFEEAVDGDLKELYRKKVIPHGEKAFVKPEEGIKKVRTGHYAFTVETHWGYKIIADTFLESEKCGLDEIRLFLLPKLSIPVIKKSGYREIFTLMNTLQRDVGLHSRVKRRWLLSKPECDSHGRGYVSVGLTDFKPALQVMGYGYLVSLLVFVVELLHHYRKELLAKIKNEKTLQAWDEVDYDYKRNKKL